MTRIGGIGGSTAPARRVARGAGGFALPEGAPDAASAAASAPGVPALLALQEAPAPPAGQPEERARRRAGMALDELRGLQLDLLRGRADTARLERLAELAGPAEHVADPTLRAALAEVALRARVELARRRVATASGG